MKILWEYPLGTDEGRSGYRYEGPIHIQGKWLYYVSSHPHLLLHILDQDTGTGKCRRLFPENSQLPAHCFLLPVGEDVLLYCGDLIRIRDGEVHRDLPFPGKGNLVSHLVIGERLYLVFRGLNAALVCVDMTKLHILWETDLRSKPYAAGPVTVFGDKLACFGQNQLLYIDPETGAVTGSLKLPRIGKLFQPVDLGDGRLLLGYTNWTNAGVLCMDTGTKKVLWRHKRSFEGPLLRCCLTVMEDRVFWVKNDTELCCVRLSDGAELYRRWTDPWLYTPLELAPEGLVFGTAGGTNSFLRCLDPDTGAERWKIPMQDGCAFYARREDTIFTGDCSCRLFQIRASDGEILQTLDTGTEVVGRFHFHGDSLYTVLWCDDTRPCRLVRVKI